MEGPLGVICPVCGKEISSRDLPVPDDTIKVIGLDHGDHLIVIKYDKFGVIRDYTVYNWVKSSENGIEVECPLCGKKEKIEINETPIEFAFNHGDHVLLINVIGEDIIIPETIPLVTLKSKEEEISVEEILEKLGSDGLATVIVLGMSNSETIRAPTGYKESIKILLEKIGLNNVNVKEGKLELLPEEEITFMKNLIDKNKKKSSSLVTKLATAVKLLKKIENLIYESHKNGNLDASYLQLIELLKRKDAYGLLSRIMKKKYNIEI